MKQDILTRLDNWFDAKPVWFQAIVNMLFGVVLFGVLYMIVVSI